MLSSQFDWKMLTLTAVLVGATSVSRAATISNITYIPPDGGGNLQLPAGVLTTAEIFSLNTGLATSPTNRNVTGARDNFQSFTVLASDFPLGINASGFAIQYNAAPASPTINLGIVLYRVVDAQNPVPVLADVPPANILLQNPTSGAGSLLFASPTTAGTAVFNFDAPVTLLPGAYVWRFHVAGASTTGVFGWNRSTNSSFVTSGFAGEGDFDAASGVAVAANTNDDHFGIIGTPIPEPQSLLIATIGCIGCGVLRLRRRA